VSTPSPAFLDRPWTERIHANSSAEPRFVANGAPIMISAEALRRGCAATPAPTRSPRTAYFTIVKASALALARPLALVALIVTL
jgi:hypothetical protein